jgi:hypothetical protein
VDPRKPDDRREAAQRDAESVKREPARIRLLNTPPHRNLDGERGGALGEDARPASGEEQLGHPNAERR